MVWYSHLFQNFPQFIVIHTVKGFGIVIPREVSIKVFHYIKALNDNIMCPVHIIKVMVNLS